MEVCGKTNLTAVEKRHRSTKKWAVSKLNKEALIEHLKEKLEGTMDSDVTSCMNLLVEGCGRAMTLVSLPRGRNQIYWWSPSIADARRKCVIYRRKVQRERKKGDSQELNAVAAEYRSQRKALKILICAAKDKCWKEICDEVQSNIRGRGYKIAMGRMVRETT